MIHNFKTSFQMALVVSMSMLIFLGTSLFVIFTRLKPSGVFVTFKIRNIFHMVSYFLFFLHQMPIILPK